MIVDFISTAQIEIIEISTTLSAVTAYYSCFNKFRFWRPVEELLKRGVNIKYYVLDPNSNEDIEILLRIEAKL